MNRVVLGERVKVIEKRSHPERYGRVGTLDSVRGWWYYVRFDDGVVKGFDRSELRMGVRKHV